MPTNDQRDAVRFDLDADGASLPDSTINMLYSRAEGLHGTNSAAVESQVRLYVVERLWAAAAKRNDYTQNESSEKASQIFSNLEKLRKRYADELEDAINGVVSSVNYGGLRRYNQRLVEFPDDYPARRLNVDVSRPE